MLALDCPVPVTRTVCIIVQRLSIASASDAIKQYLDYPELFVFVDAAEYRYFRYLIWNDPFESQFPALTSCRLFNILVFYDDHIVAYGGDPRPVRRRLPVVTVRKHRFQWTVENHFRYGCFLQALFAEHNDDDVRELNYAQYYLETKF